jgi:signal transduction histidine kinase
MAQVLAAQGLRGRVVPDIAGLRTAILGEIGAVIVAEEALNGSNMRELITVLDIQPAWSDLPIVFLASSARATLSVRDLGNVTVLEKPLHVETLVASVRSALRGRRRQYAARAAIVQREQFLAMLGHELRNPLSAVVFAAELASRKPDPRVVEQQLGVIMRQATHLSRLVDDLLEVSRVTSGKVILDRQVHELGESVQRAIQSQEQALLARTHQLTYAAKQQPIWVHADGVRLEQIFSNLLTNAIKYTPPGGAIDISVEAVGHEGVVRIRDTGIGIEREMLSRIFDLFEQAAAGLDRAEGGMGLGLTLVRRLVDLHGGSIEAHSEGVGHGSELVVRFPTVDNPEVTLVAPPPVETRAEALRLVLVEDSADLCDTFAELLREAGHDVQVAMDGPGGVELITNAKPDCAFVDIGLPGLDGYQVARQVRSHVGRDTQLVALTGYGQPEDRQRALEAGFDRHLKKPIDVKLVTTLLREVPRRPWPEQR